MKKRKYFILIAIFAALLGLFAFVSCGKPTVSVPVGLSIDESTLVLSWSEVENAKSYRIDLGETEAETRKNSYSLAGLETGEYQIRVMAVSGMGDYENSAWSETIGFTREYECGLSYRLVNNNTAYEVSGMGTAPGDVVMTSSFRGKPVVGIGEKAFNNTSKLKSLVIADSVVYIGARAFANCSQLESVTIPESVTEIGAYAFQSCRAVGEMSVPGSVKTIGEYAFSYCRGLERITFGNGVERLGDYAFTECTALTEAEIPASVLSVGAYCFYDSTAMEKAVIGENPTGPASLAIGDYAFSKSGISELTIGGGVSAIGNYAFSNCASLTAIDVPDSVTSIGEGAFWSDENLVDVKIGDGLVEMGRFAFLASGIWIDAADLVYADRWLVGNKNTALSAVSVGGDTVGIGSWAFYLSNKLTRITIPDSVKTIGDCAFYACSSLVDVTVGDGVEEIGEYAFYRCSILTNVMLGSGVKTIGRSAFSGCARLAEITIPDSVSKIGTSAFNGTALWENTAEGEVVYADKWAVGWRKEYYWFNEEGGWGDGVVSVALKEGTVGVSDYCFYDAASLMYEITFPNSVRYLGRCAFYENKYLMSVSLSENITRIEEYTFYKCGFLYKCNIPDGVTYIGRSAFYQCAAMFALSIDIPDSVKTIEDYAFYDSGVVLRGMGKGVETIGNKAFGYCRNLTEVHLPDSLVSIGERAFYACEKLSVLTFGSNLQYIGERAFYKCTSLTELVIPDSVVSLGRYAFYKCSVLTSVTFGSGLDGVPDYAFYGCSSLKSLYLPDTIKSIGIQSFRNCSELEGVTIAGNIEVVSKHAFYGCKNVTFYCEAAEKPEGWDPAWNSYYRPVVWNSVLSPDNSYVVSVVKGGILNPLASGGISAPDREGYTFIGWTTEENGTTAQYKADELNTVEDGVTLYAVWQEGEAEPDEKEIPEETLPDSSEAGE